MLVSLPAVFEAAATQTSGRGGRSGRPAAASRLGGDPAALLEDELPVHRVAVPGHRHGRGRSSARSARPGCRPTRRGPSRGRTTAARPTRSGRRRRPRRRPAPRRPDRRRCDPRPRWAISTRRSPRSTAVATAISRFGRASSAGSTPSRAASAAASAEPSRSRTDSCADGLQVGEGRQPERVVVVPVGDHDRRQRPIGDRGHRRRGRPGPARGWIRCRPAGRRSEPTTSPRLTASGSATATKTPVATSRHGPSAKSTGGSVRPVSTGSSG